MKGSYMLVVILSLTLPQKSQALEALEALEAAGSPGCDLCVQIVTAIDDFITDASTEQDIIDFVEEVR